MTAPIDLDLVRADVRTLCPDARDVVRSLCDEVERLRAVADAGRAWRDTRGDSGTIHQAACRANLLAALDALDAE